MRRRYLVAYDIRDDQRLRAIATCCEGYGDRIQYSVFIADLSATEIYAMRQALEALMNQAVDSIMIIELGMAGDKSRFLFLGKHEELPLAEAVIV